MMMVESSRNGIIKSKVKIKQFIFISSIKVNGEFSLKGQPFEPDDKPNPQDDYAISKYEAEQGLIEISTNTGLEVVIIRPPLVYGPGVRANFLSMMKWAQSGVPLPFGAVHNKRSLIALDNLVSFIIHCIEHPKAATEIFLVSDDDAVSTTDLLTSRGPVFYWSQRVGENNVVFRMPKFRSMKVGTPAVATHLLQDPHSALTSIGNFLRKSSIDELPQLWCILRGEMSFVGPRPALFNQDDLVVLRTERGVSELLPGLTGWAQVNGRDEIPIPQKVGYDVEYKLRKSFSFDLYIIWLTVLKVLRRSDVSH